MVLRGKSLLALMLCLLVGLVGGCGGGGGGQGGGGGGDENTITIGYIDWDEDVACGDTARRGAGLRRGDDALGGRAPVEWRGERRHRDLSGCLAAQHPRQ